MSSMDIIQIPKNQPCPCFSGLKYEACCEPFLNQETSKKQKPKTAEQLLRSRYTAFVIGDVDYIVSTHHSQTSSEINRDEIMQWSHQSEWHGLKILQKEAGEAKDNQGTIIFHAQYTANDKLNDHFEKAIFEKEDGQWKFKDGQGVHQGTFVRSEPKVGRNDPCSCGSGKKFKKCHGKE